MGALSFLRNSNHKPLAYDRVGFILYSTEEQVKCYFYFMCFEAVKIVLCNFELNDYIN